MLRFVELLPELSTCRWRATIAIRRFGDDYVAVSIYSGSDSATYHGLQALKVYGIDDSDLIKSMLRVSAVLAVLVEKWCRLEQIR
jgi:hypothetical protein